MRLLAGLLLASLWVGTVHAAAPPEVARKARGAALASAKKSGFWDVSNPKLKVSLRARKAGGFAVKAEVESDMGRRRMITGWATLHVDDAGKVTKPAEWDGFL